MTQPEFKYFAFINNNAKATACGKKLKETGALPPES